MPKATELPSVPVKVSVLEAVSVLPAAIVSTPLADEVIVKPLTVVGVIAPNTNVNAGVVVQVAQVAETPLAVTTETDVTVPDPPPPPVTSVIVFPFTVIEPLLTMIFVGDVTFGLPSTSVQVVGGTDWDSPQMHSDAQSVNKINTFFIVFTFLAVVKYRSRANVSAFARL